MNRILIIDDDNGILQTVSDFLPPRGFEISVASDGEQGVFLASEKLPDLILCDLFLPRLDGCEILAALRCDERLADIPVLFLAGSDELEEARQDMNLGADHYLTKPFDGQTLCSAVEARLKRHKSERCRREKQIEAAMQLLAKTVHDLRDPRSITFGHADLLQGVTDATQRTEEVVTQIVGPMQQAILRVQAILSETLLLAKSHATRLRFDPRPFDLRSFCQDLLADHEAKPRLRFCCGEGKFFVVADPFRLRQALENLISNALKYSEEPVLLRLAHNSGRYCVEVSDKGIGTPQDEQGRVFEPFFRASNTSGRPGHGLGLCLVKICIERQGGHIRFHSEHNRGTVFVVELLRSDPTLRASPKHPRQRVWRVPGGSATGSGRTEADAVGRLGAMIVDGDALARRVLRDLLETDKDIDILGEAGTLAQARSLARRCQPNVVFLDVSLPDGLGFDLLAHLNPHIAVVFVTSAEHYAVHAFECGAADYLLKPVSRERLQRTLARVRQRLFTQVGVAAASGSKQISSFLLGTSTEKTVVNVSQIRSISSDGEYSMVHWGVAKNALLRKPLKQWELELPAETFARVHRKAIVNLAFMEKVVKDSAGRLQMHLEGMKNPIQISLRKAPALNRKLKALYG
ncbi:MAG: response regulator [Verrucomicrobia bacterium]|nr:response regulator [Verrucomicrobiota bacterium]